MRGIKLIIILIGLLSWSCQGQKETDGKQNSVVANIDTLIMKVERTDERIDKDIFFEKLKKNNGKQKLEDGTIKSYRYYFNSRRADPAELVEINALPTGYESYKAYHPNGVLKLEAQNFQGLSYGIWSYYDSLGYLTKRVDYDLGYIDIKEMVIKFKEDTKIDLQQSNNFKVDISRIEVKGMPFYSIDRGFYIGHVPIICYYLDGITGNLIFEAEYLSLRWQRFKPDLDKSVFTSPDERFEKYLDSIKYESGKPVQDLFSDKNNSRNWTPLIDKYLIEQGAIVQNFDNDVYWRLVWDRLGRY